MKIVSYLLIYFKLTAVKSCVIAIFTIVYSFKLILSKEKTESAALACSSNKPYNCSNECYGNDEFCTNDAVYSCLSPHNHKQLHDWCLTKNVSDIVAGESKICHAICVHLKAATQGIFLIFKILK